MNPIYKDTEKRKEYLREYHKARYAKQKESKEYLLRKCIRSVKGLRKEIGDYNTNRVVEVLERIYKDG